MMAARYSDEMLYGMTLNPFEKLKMDALMENDTVQIVDNRNSNAINVSN